MGRLKQIVAFALGKRNTDDCCKRRDGQNQRMDLTMENILISIVIPCFNAQKTLAKTINSVLQQKYPNFEILIVDDGSTDRSPEIIAEYEQKYKFIRNIKQANQGVAAARNNGVKAARGEWIAFLDADDLLYENSLTERVKAIQEYWSPEMLGVFCPAEMITDNGKKMGFGLIYNKLSSSGRVYFSHYHDCIFLPSCSIVSKLHFQESGGFDEMISPAEDYDLWHRMMRSGGYFRFVGGCKIGYTQHPESAVRSRLLTHFNQCKIVTQRISSPSELGIKECRDGFGKALCHISMSQRALSTAFMAIAAGDYAVADTVISDISCYAIETMDLKKLESLLKSSAARALCKHERDWLYVIWPQIHKNVVRFFEDLDKRFEGKSQNVRAMMKICQESRYIQPILVYQRVHSGSIASRLLNRLLILFRMYIWHGL
ncbi:MAG: glycosyltransferase, partial [Proteobacteria bacterium]|nr:glycosyltransferase [Pseudomonadota bacterium]